MREIATHKVKANEPVRITVLDIPGEGNACHDYQLEAGEYRRVINFQNGVIPVNGINGVTNEALLAIVADRLEGFQAGKFRCDENAAALKAVRAALGELKDRTATRMAQGVEGQNVKHESPPRPSDASEPPKPAKKRAKK